MKNFTKVLALALCFVLLLSVATACGKKKEATGYIVLEEALEAEQFGIGFRNEDIALGMAVQDTLDEMIEDGKFGEISTVWFGEDVALTDVDYIEDTTIAADDTSLTDLQARGKLVMGLDDSFPPMGYRDENNEIVGFDIDLATEVCERLGVTLELQPIEWASKEAELSSGRIDCIWNGMTINDERIENMFIPKAYVANKQVIIVAADSDIKGPADLAGKKVALQNGSSALEALEKNAVYDEVEEVIQLADNQLVYLELKSGRVDAVVMDEPVGRYIITNDSGN